MFQTYFKTFQSLYLADGESSELTYRTPLETLLNSFVGANINRNLVVKHEPTKQEDKGRPDFKITTKEQLTIGLIETKKPGEDLKKHLNTKQLNNYKQLSDNIILTDYMNFYLIRKGEPVLNTELFADYSLQNKRFKLEQSRIDELTRLFTNFFESEPETIGRTQDLALKLSEKARFLKDYGSAILENDNDEENLLHGLFSAFQKSLLPLLEKKFFADIYAQTLTYGLFLAALNCNDPEKELNKVTAYSLLPNTFPLIKELFHRLDDFPAEIVWAVDEIISILKVTDFAAIKKEFADYRHKEKGFNDPFIFFYEDFLKHYDKSQRELRGVYYTPEPVVSFIVRSIDVILKETFGIKDGFVNKDVTLLDFATGTGTFLLNSINLAIEQAKKIGDKQTVNKILNEQVIKNFYGFELLVAPYVIAHLKISEFLKEQGFSINPGNRLNIFLTNTLTNQEPASFQTMPSLSKEGKEANKVKNKDILVVLGNPPYSVSSSNKIGFIAEQKMNRYKEAVKSEKNIQPLSDDYIKFIRFAHWKMENAERGVIGIITNNSFVDGLIHRGMRQELMKDFDEIYILNLHGNSRIKEVSPDGSKDENVFDIMQGVCISFFIKKDNQSNKDCKVFYKDLHGLRENKYNFLLNNFIKTVDWIELFPEKSNFFFSIKELSNNYTYDKGLLLNFIFNEYGSGIEFGRDDLFIDFNQNDLDNKIIKLFSNELDENFINFFNVKDTGGFSLIKRINDFKYNKSNIFNTCYRPFDLRFSYYQEGLTRRPSYEIMKYFIEKNNTALITTRQYVENIEFSFSFVTNLITDRRITTSNRGAAYIFPIFIYKNDETYALPFELEENIDNFTKEFKEFIKTKYSGTYTPEQILGYIYAALHSPTYRTKYIEFLKIDFPRIPFTDDEALFRELSEIGTELIDHHLLKNTYSDNICRFEGTGENFKVEKVEYEELDMNESREANFLYKATGVKSGRVWINKQRCFEPIPEPIWSFYIGGYQVLEKWLKERKKHEITLSAEDIQHFIKVVNVLDATIRIMKQIDDKTKEWI